MKQFIFRISVFLFFWVAIAFAIQAQNLVNTVKNGFQTGNIAVLSSYFSADMGVSTPLGDGEDKSGSVVMLTNFFSAETARSFTIKHNGTAPNGSQFLIGTLVTTKGSYRVTVSLRNNGIEQIDIE
ncbi:MAG: DUF4783 domain-containing protein [Chitinophagales bacterium]|jgi:hypothetical protein|nr:DUF4783 domain-containing protein [Chitinophagales bacterium]